ncbi:MAG: XkdX family protein [Clostridiales bacterium]|nr:XkdX family protein [Clostridiales bacterium]
MMFETIADYFHKGLFTEDDIKSFVFIGWLTEAEQNQILNQ